MLKIRLVFGDFCKRNNYSIMGGPIAQNKPAREKWRGPISSYISKGGVYDMLEAILGGAARIKPSKRRNRGGVVMAACFGAPLR